MAAHEISVAGIRIHTKQFNKSRGRSYFNGLNILNIMKVKNELQENPNTTPISGFPEDSLIRSIKWSPDSKFISCLVLVKEQVELWIVNPNTGVASKLSGAVNASLTISSYKWKKNSRELFFTKAINKGNEIPSAPIPPFSPSIRSNLSGLFDLKIIC